MKTPVYLTIALMRCSRSRYYIRARQLARARATQ